MVHMLTTSDKYRAEKIEVITIDQSLDTRTAIALIVAVHSDKRLIESKKAYE